MTSAQVVETSVTNNDLSQGYPHPDYPAKPITDVQTIYYSGFDHKTLCSNRWSLSLPGVSSVSPFQSAAHYWPLDKTSGIYDVKSKRYGDIQGTKRDINFAGPNGEFLYAEGTSWIDLGDFKGTCLSDPMACANAMTVSLWLRYSFQRDNNKQYFLGTISRERPQGFAIFSESRTKAKDVVVVRVSTTDREWTGTLQLPPGRWAHVMFTWSNTSGLSVYKNCLAVSLTQNARSVSRPTVASPSNSLATHLSLSSSNDGRKKTEADCSYDDVTVWYSSLPSHMRNSLCRDKVGKWVYRPIRNMAAAN